MSMISTVRAFLRDPRLEGVDIDTPALMDVHRQILSEKPLMRHVFNEFYDLCVALNRQYLSGAGAEIEFGAGVSLFKQAFPHIISTDIKPSPYLDRVLDAQAMDLPDVSVRVLYGINCFHHLPQPRKFFAELDRVLVPGGGAILIEPYYGAFARLLYKYVHTQEGFDLTQKAWESDQPIRQVMSGANQALSQLVFVRDRTQFESEIPTLEIVHQATLSNYVRYLLSGGVNFKQLIPNLLEGPVKMLEWLMRPIEPLTALHYVIVIRKRSQH
jgi:SAM-dependent methyltransferase